MSSIRSQQVTQSHISHSATASKRSFSVDDSPNTISKRQKINATGAKSDLDVRPRTKPSYHDSHKSITGDSMSAHTVAVEVLPTAKIPPSLPADFFDNSSQPRKQSSNTMFPPQPLLDNGGRGGGRGGRGRGGEVSEGVDEDEWAAFQAEVAEPTYINNGINNTPIMASINSSTVVISAAPISAAELAAKNDGGGNVNENGNIRDDEAEDARQKLFEEFEEMESLEQRVLRLKQQREALRTLPVTATRMEMEVVVPTTADKLEDEDEDNEEEEEEEEDDDDEDWIHLSR